MIYNFKFGNKWLSDLHAVSTETPQIEIAERDFNLIDIPGRSGQEYIDNGRFKNVDFTRNIGFKERGNNTVDNLINWLAANQGYQPFEDTDHPGLVTDAVCTNFSSVVRQLRTIHSASVKFSRKPYWYDKSGMNFITLDKTARNTVSNDADYDAFPIIRVEFPAGVGTSTFTLRFYSSGKAKDVTYTVIYDRPGYNQYALIDTEKELATFNDYNGTVKAYLGSVKDFVLKAHSETQISLVDTDMRTVQNLRIMPRWRCL